MPIRPENRSRYPADWPGISLAARERAQWRCQWPGCGVRNYSVGAWLPKADGSKVWHPLSGNGRRSTWSQTMAGCGLAWPKPDPLTYAEAKAFAAWGNAFRRDIEFEGQWLRPHYIVIVLTVAHRDHQPENCAPDNLRAWCQRHHLAYDAEHHARTRQASRRAQRAIGELF